MGGETRRLLPPGPPAPLPCRAQPCQAQPCLAQPSLAQPRQVERCLALPRRPRATSRSSPRRSTRMSATSSSSKPSATSPAEMGGETRQPTPPGLPAPLPSLGLPRRAMPGPATPSPAVPRPAQPGLGMPRHGALRSGPAAGTARAIRPTCTFLLNTPPDSNRRSGPVSFRSHPCSLSRNCRSRNVRGVPPRVGAGVRRSDLPPPVP